MGSREDGGGSVRLRGGLRAGTWELVGGSVLRGRAPACGRSNVRTGRRVQAALTGPRSGNGLWVGGRHRARSGRPEGAARRPGCPGLGRGGDASSSRGAVTRLRFRAFGGELGTSSLLCRVGVRQIR